MNLSKSAATLRSPHFNKKKKIKQNYAQTATVARYRELQWSPNRRWRCRACTPPETGRIFHPTVRSTWTPFLLPLQLAKYWKTSGRNLFHCFLCSPWEERFINKAPHRMKSAISCVSLKKATAKWSRYHVPSMFSRENGIEEKGYRITNK